MFAEMNSTDQFIFSVIKISTQFAFLYVAGIIFFFYLRSRRMRNIYKDIKNYSKHRLIDRKIKFKGVLVMMVLVYWLLVGARNRGRPEIQAFCDWLLAQAAVTRRAIGEVPDPETQAHPD
jgi:Na+/H+ antiporter NhaD/arsenite permease-like protein